MRKKIFIFVFLFSLVFVVGTPVLKLENSAPQPREVVFGTISTDGEFLEELNKNDIMFYEGRKQVYFDFDLYYYDGTYYFSVVFNREGDFTIKTKEILYNLAGEVGAKEIIKDISVYYDSYNNETGEVENVMEIKPGIVYTLSNKSKITIFNRGSNDLSVTVDDVSLTIGAYQAKIINLNLIEPISFIEVSSYKSFSIPVIYLNADITDSEIINETVVIESNLGINPSELEIRGFRNSTIKEIIYLENSGEFNVTGLEMINNINQAKIDVPYSVEPNSESNITVQVFLGDFSRNETINLTYIENDTEFNLLIPVFIEVLEVNESDDVIVTPLCSDLGGEICDGKCEGESNFTSDGYCCYGECVPISEESGESEGSGFGWIAGVLIFIILGIIGYFIYKKYRKTKPESPEKKIDDSKKHYQNRMSGVITRH